MVDRCHQKQVVSLRNPVWKLANSSKLAKGDLEKLFARVKQMNGVDENKYWRKRPPWKQSNYLRGVRSDKTLQKLKSSLHVASRHGYFHGKFGAIERLNLLRALTPLLCQSHRDKYLEISCLLCISFCFIILYVTI